MPLRVLHRSRVSGLSSSARSAWEFRPSWPEDLDAWSMFLEGVGDTERLAFARTQRTEAVVRPHPVQ